MYYIQMASRRKMTRILDAYRLMFQINGKDKQTVRKTTNIKLCYSGVASVNEDYTSNLLLFAVTPT